MFTRTQYLFSTRQDKNSGTTARCVCVHLKYTNAIEKQTVLLLIIPVYARVTRPRNYTNVNKSFTNTSVVQNAAD